MRHGYEGFRNLGAPAVLASLQNLELRAVGPVSHRLIFEPSRAALAGVKGGTCF